MEVEIEERDFSYKAQIQWKSTLFEIANSNTSQRVRVRLSRGYPNPNLRLLQSSVSTSVRPVSENLIQMTIVKPAVIAKRREGKGSLVELDDALKLEVQFSFVK